MSKRKYCDCPRCSKSAVDVLSVATMREAVTRIDTPVLDHIRRQQREHEAWLRQAQAQMAAENYREDEELQRTQQAFQRHMQEHIERQRVSLLHDAFLHDSQEEGWYV